MNHPPRASSSLRLRAIFSPRERPGRCINPFCGAAGTFSGVEGKEKTKARRGITGGGERSRHRSLHLPLPTGQLLSLGPCLHSSPPTPSNCMPSTDWSLTCHLVPRHTLHEHDPCLSHTCCGQSSCLTACEQGWGCPRECPLLFPASPHPTHTRPFRHMHPQQLSSAEISFRHCVHLFLTTVAWTAPAPCVRDSLGKMQS